MRESGSWTLKGMRGGKHLSVCKLRVAGPPSCLAALLSCLYYLRLEVEKLDLRVVPAFFFLSSPHRPLYTWSCRSLSEAGWMAGSAGERKNVQGKGGLGTFPFTSPQWLFLFISNSTRRNLSAAWNSSHETVPWGQTTDAWCMFSTCRCLCNTCTYTDTQKCVTPLGHSVR